MGGHISLIGVLTGTTAEVNHLPVVHKAVTVQGVYAGSREIFEEMNRAIELHGIKPIVDRTFHFTEAKKALEYLQSGAHFGKICLTFE